MYPHPFLNILRRGGRAGVQLGQFDRKTDLSGVFVRKLLVKSTPEEGGGVVGGLSR